MNSRLRSPREQLWFRHKNKFLSIAGRDPTAAERLDTFLANHSDRVRPARADQPLPDRMREFDYAQIDPQLSFNTETEQVHARQPNSEPVSYGGLTPSERGYFYHWLRQPLDEAPPRFQNLYLAYLECALFGKGTDDAIEELLRLSQSDSWQSNPDLGRTLLLAGWIAQLADPITLSIRRGRLDARTLVTAFAWLAAVDGRLESDHVRIAAATWNIHPAGNQEIRTESLAVALSSLTASLGMDPARYALFQSLDRSSDDESILDSDHWLPWRAVHRDLRISLPQPPIRPHLEPLVSEMLTFAPPAGTDGETSADDEQEMQPEPRSKWTLILEFGVSRSYYYKFVLQRVQEMTGYQLILDENRQMIHRIHFAKKDMRRFWAIWESVQGWSSTRVYLNGEELKSWKIWPYSPYLR